MNRFIKFLGITGLVLFLFGLFSLIISGGLNIYNEFHMGAGILLLVIYIVVDFSSLLEGFRSRSVKYGAETFIYGLIILAIIVIVNLIVYKVPERWDTTANKIYSLSPESKKVAKMVPKGTVMLAFFEGGNAGSVEDILRTYDYASSNLSYEVVDPEKHPELAEKYQVNRDKTVVVAYKDRFFKAVENSEQGITNALLKLVKGQHKKIYFVTGHGEHSIKDNSAEGYSIIKKALQDDNFVVDSLFILDRGSIPTDASAIVVASPSKNYLPEELNAITEYIKRGGHAIFLIDPLEDAGFKNYLEKWGVKLDDDVIIDKSVRLFGGPSLGVFPVVTDYGMHPATKGMDGKRTIFPMARSLEKVDFSKGTTVASFLSDLKITPLAKTSNASWGETNVKRLFEKHQAEINDNDIKGPLAVAFAVEKDLNGKNKGINKRKGEKKQVRIIVVGDSDFIANKFAQSLYNMDFFLNMVNWLAGEEQFVTIRPKAIKYSRVNFTEDQMATMFYLSVLIIPELIILLGLYVWNKRR